MYFEIDNTPEHIKRSRRAETLKVQAPVEPIPRLVVAPFSRPPQVLFENVLIGTSCERDLEILNPSKQVLQLTLGRALPPGLSIDIPGEWLVLEPETCYCLRLVWTPMQPTALRETVRFTNESRGRYDVIVVLKSVQSIKDKVKGSKVSPGKIKKKTNKRSPEILSRKKTEIIFNATVKKTVQTTKTSFQRKITSNKENCSDIANNVYSVTPRTAKCPFASPNNDFTFDTSEIFSSIKYSNDLQKTYDREYATEIRDQNVLKPSNKQNLNDSNTDLFDNLKFTPLKSVATKSKLDKGPNIVFSLASDGNFENMLDLRYGDQENMTHSIMSITSVPNNDHKKLYEESVPEYNVQNKKIPNTSSPKEHNASPNFSINTEFSRISELSFFPQRFSTEKKNLPKPYDLTQDTIDDSHLNFQIGSDTFTKASPNIVFSSNEQPISHVELMPPHYFQQKACKQSLFRDVQNQRETYDYVRCNQETEMWKNNLRSEVKSPLRSITPPLQSIPEESTQFSETHVLDNSNKHAATFTIDKTFDKSARMSTWSKKAVRVESDIWKKPVGYVRKSFKNTTVKEKDANTTSIEKNKCDGQNISLNQVGNVYSMSLTVNPFLSATYYYDEKDVGRFEVEFKKWLNYILTPPADLESNTEIKIDIGKAWVENRNKEIPAAPTREQVCNVYHNSHRLESVRRSARALLRSPEIVQVIEKLDAQINKKLIAIRSDRNLHLDVGLQKIIMEILLSYNPLWLRIGLEAIYGVVVPLKSNSDVEGLTMFIIQRMFRNPYLRNKNSKSAGPNMLLPAYMDAIKKFTLKKFFTLVFFLDQAKQRRLISHDPCLFRRNALCKESREIIITFTKELIAGIGDITRHLRPLGYVVCHKQSHLDEYKYAVHNIATDIRDGVRLTKVMEIILMKNGLMNQMRTPAISRLQKIHNVQVALTALKEANFVIDGDIEACDIADGHREKTLALLWQIIHVFRAPLFVKSANVIQVWWRKKYELIKAKREEEMRVLMQQNNAASVIQCWWRKIQYNRFVEAQMKLFTSATITVQKYCRMWLARRCYRLQKTGVLKIEEWYRCIKLIREAKQIYYMLRLEKEEKRRIAAIVIQKNVRRWLCVSRYQKSVKKVILMQSIVRTYILVKRFQQLRKAASKIQEKYRAKLQMNKELNKFAVMRKSAIIIQSNFRMMVQYRYFNKLKKAAKTIEDRYVALIQMKKEIQNFQQVKTKVVFMQSLVKRHLVRKEYIRQRNAIINIQRRVKANQMMKRQRAAFLEQIRAATVIQKQVRAHIVMKRCRQHYLLLRSATVLLQKSFRSYILTKSLKSSYIALKNAAIVLQRRYRSRLAMLKSRAEYLKLKAAAINVQRRYKAQVAMRRERKAYENLRAATIAVQRQYRAQILKRNAKNKFLKLKSSCQIIQSRYRAYILGKNQRLAFGKMKIAAISIQMWYRRCTTTAQTKQQYQRTKQACVTIQRQYRANIECKNQRLKYVKIRSATLTIQKHYRLYKEMKSVRAKFILLKTSTIKIQRYFRSVIETRMQTLKYLRYRNAVLKIQYHYRNYQITQIVRKRYCALRNAAVIFQRRYRSICLLRNDRSNYVKLKNATVSIQQWYRALVVMKTQRQAYLQLRAASVKIQNRFRANMLMKRKRSAYLKTKSACITIQKAYKAFVEARTRRTEYITLRTASITIQRRYRALLAMKKEKTYYAELRNATLIIQKRFRAQYKMLKVRSYYRKLFDACCVVQRRYKALILGRKHKTEYDRLKNVALLIQRRFRQVQEMRKTRCEYLKVKKFTIFIQRQYRANRLARELRRNKAASIIQSWYKVTKSRNNCRRQYVTVRNSTIRIQSVFRMYVQRTFYLRIKHASVSIQRYYRNYKVGASERQQYLRLKNNVIHAQAHIRGYIARNRYLKIKSAAICIQSAFRLKKQRDALQKRREDSAVCIQSYFRRYLARRHYLQCRERIMYIQNYWRSRILLRRERRQYLETVKRVIKLQAVIRGMLTRRRTAIMKKELLKIREKQIQHWASSKIQALFRGHRTRLQSDDPRVAALRCRWRAGALQSTQQSLQQRNDDAMEVLFNYSHFDLLITAFASLKLLTEVYPMQYSQNATAVVKRIDRYLTCLNRSISSVQVLKLAAAILVNLARYKVTGPLIYERERVLSVLKFMWRFGKKETEMFCMFSTLVWLFAKYPDIREDLTNFLQMPEQHRLMQNIKDDIDSLVKTSNKNFKSRTSVNLSMRKSIVASPLPALNPDYGIIRADRPPYFEDPSQAIDCLFRTYQL